VSTIIKRRNFLTALGAGVAWPLVAQAQQQQQQQQQQTALPVVGFLSSASPRAFATLMNAFRDGLQSQGLAHGRDIWIEYRWAEGHYDELPKLATDLVDRKVALIAATGGVVSAQAALKATTAIPVVFVVGFDPVVLGLVSSLNKPGGNATGVSIFTTELATKRLQLLKDMFPTIATVAILVNPESVATEIEVKNTTAAAQKMEIAVVTLEANSEKDLETAFDTAVARKAGALLVSADPFFTSRRTRLIALAARHALPTMYPFSVYVEAGGLMSYGTELPWAYFQAGLYAARILKGDKPSDLPVVLPSNFDLAINMKTVKALGITVPPLVSALAQRVLE
jgi:putative ABC transport system substrate-binding protein